jgi:hypothetical protein
MHQLVASIIYSMLPRGTTMMLCFDAHRTQLSADYAQHASQSRHSQRFDANHLGILTQQHGNIFAIVTQYQPTFEDRSPLNIASAATSQHRYTARLLTTLPLTFPFRLHDSSPLYESMLD